MAETAVNIVIDKLIPLLREEVTLLRGVHGQITSIKEELELIRAYLKDADEKAEMASTNNVVTQWVKQMREVSFRIEDVIDEYLLKVAKRGQKHGFVGVLSKIGRLLKSIIPRNNITSEIVGIRESIDRLGKRRETLGFNSVSESYSAETSPRHNLRMGALFMEDDQLVGVDKTRKMLTDWLLHGESIRTVISVVGEGGIGKTTIVNNIYKKQKENRSFDCYAWITVSRTLKAEKLLKVMIQRFYEEEKNKSAAERIKNETINKESLISELREYLQGRSYMIVFDDIWDREFWGVVEFALPNQNDKRNRIMITTRDRGVAEFCASFAPVHIHELNPLPPNDALKLFFLKAFQFDPKGCPEELIELSEDFVKKCEGVPLAIVAIAGLLSTKKKNVSEWKRVHDSLRSKLATDPYLRSFYQVLLESYNDLPYQHKLCLLYFGLFPEDHTINHVRLIHLWIAEGFVKQRDNENHTLEELAEEYLDELIRRNLVKMWNLRRYHRVRIYGVHDLMHDFILKKCEELNFCQVVKSEGFCFHSWTRRLSIQKHDIDDNLQGATKYGRVRSCFFINIQELPKLVIESLLSSFKLLIALDFQDATLDYLPEAVGNLLLLKYLNLRSTKIKTIPKFIGKLLNLETLELKHTLVRELPEDISQLVKLRHLRAYNFNWDHHHLLANFHGVKLKAGIGHLKALQTLSFVDTTDGDSVIKELNNLKHMRKLGITKLRRNNGKLLCNAIQGMKYLYSLSIEAVEENEVLDLHSIIYPPQYLQRLFLLGCLERLPKWISKLKNLVQLSLTWSGLEEDPLFILKDLPKLMILHLRKSYEGDDLHFKSGWFKSLEVLSLVSMQRLRSLKIDEGALPLLEELWLEICPQMVEVPIDIQNLKTLKLLVVREVPIINNMKGKCFNIFNHISEVKYLMEGEYIHFY